MGDIVYVVDKVTTILVVNVASGEITEISPFTTNIETPIIFGLADISPKGDFFYTGIGDGVAKYDTAMLNLVGVFDITSPISALVVNSGDNTVTIIDAQSLEVLNTVQVGPTPNAYRRFISKGSSANGTLDPGIIAELNLNLKLN